MNYDIFSGILAGMSLLLSLPASAEVFSEDPLNFEITGENSCRLISSPDVSGVVGIPPAVMYENMEYNVTAIAPSALADARGLEALFVPGTVTAVGDGAARGCSALRVVEFGEGLSVIGSEAFVGCTSLESVVLPDGLVAVPRRCFYGASSLQSLRLGASVATIATQAFDGCGALESVVCMSPVPPALAPYAFDAAAVGKAVLTVPVGSRQAYVAESGWREFGRIVESDYGGERVAFTLMFPSGSVVTQEPLGSRVTVGITPEEGWTVAGLYLDGLDVTADISRMGYYTTPALEGETVLSLTLSGSGGVDDAGVTPVRVYRTRTGISVEGIGADTDVRVYAPDGRLLASRRGPGMIPADNPSPVILTAGTLKFKL